MKIKELKAISSCFLSTLPEFRIRNICIIVLLLHNSISIRLMIILTQIKETK